MHIHDQEIESAILSFDMSAVTQKFADERKIDIEQAQRYEAELKRYFFMCGAYKKHYAMAGKVDDLWHTFIVHTEQYSQFCDSVFGSFFHHIPAGSALKEKDFGQTMRYLRFLVDYFRHYKETPPDDIWPLSVMLFGEVKDWDIAAACVACSGCSCSGPWE
jgi:hypothetical protein